MKRFSLARSRSDGDPAAVSCGDFLESVNRFFSLLLNNQARLDKVCPEVRNGEDFIRSGDSVGIGGEPFIRRAVLRGTDLVIALEIGQADGLCAPSLFSKPVLEINGHVAVCPNFFAGIG